jgi:DNA primase
VLNAAVELYRNRLLADTDALAYLENRGLGSEVIECSALGFVAGNELMPYLSWRKLPIAAARSCGLLTRAGEERLTGRLVIPEVRQGQTVWMIGRLLAPDSSGPKYLGLPGPKPLLGWDPATRDMRGVCLVEGPLDMLALRQFGVPALALCGTGVSAGALEALKRWQRIYVLLDTDDAGAHATAHLEEALGSRVIPVRLPPNLKDPAELACRADAEEILRAAIRAAATRNSPPAPNRRA